MEVVIMTVPCDPCHVTVTVWGAISLLSHTVIRVHIIIAAQQVPYSGIFCNRKFSIIKFSSWIFPTRGVPEF